MFATNEQTAKHFSHLPKPETLAVPYCFLFWGEINNVGN